MKKAWGQKIGIPVLEEAGLGSRVSGHFGKAPMHLVVKAGTGEVVAVVSKPEGVHGQCAPVEELSMWGIAAVVCRGLGQGACRRLREVGIEVLHTEGETVREVLEAYRAGQLERIRPEQACAGHGD